MLFSLIIFSGLLVITVTSAARWNYRVAYETKQCTEHDTCLCTLHKVTDAGPTLELSYCKMDLALMTVLFCKYRWFNFSGLS